MMNACCAPCRRGGLGGGRALLRAGLAALALLTSQAVRAEIGREPAGRPMSGAVQGGGGTEQDGMQVEVDRFKAAPTSLRDALAIAQAGQADGSGKDHGGGRTARSGSRIVDASFNGETAAATYQVRTWDGATLRQIVIDARTGRMIRTEALSTLVDLDAADREMIGRLRGVRQELSEAVVVAERNTGGRAISAGLMLEHGRLQFVVVCVAGNDLKQVMLEPPAAPTGKASNNRKGLHP